MLQSIIWSAPLTINLIGLWWHSIAGRLAWINEGDCYLIIRLLDPLLPQVTAFVEQFPHFLDVVVQCTRKTEVTWWRHLFCALGRRPKDIFDHAISMEQLDTAASCLVILQNSETQATCKQVRIGILTVTQKRDEWKEMKSSKAFPTAFKCRSN